MVGGAACMDSVLCTLTGNAYSLLSTCFLRCAVCRRQERHSYRGKRASKIYFYQPSTL